MWYACDHVTRQELNSELTCRAFGEGYPPMTIFQLFFMFPCNQPPVIFKRYDFSSSQVIYLNPSIFSFIGGVMYTNWCWQWYEIVCTRLWSWSTPRQSRVHSTSFTYTDTAWRRRRSFVIPSSPSVIIRLLWFIPFAPLPWRSFAFTTTMNSEAKHNIYHSGPFNAAGEAIMDFTPINEIHQHLCAFHVYSWVLTPLYSNTKSNYAY